MLYYLSQHATEWPVLNLFRYITFRTAGALATASLIVFLFGPMVIRSLRLRMKKGSPSAPMALKPIYQRPVRQLWVV